MRRTLVFGFSALALFVVGSGWLGLYPPVPADLDGARDLDPEARHVRIPVATLDSLDGWLLPGRGRGLVLLLHGYGRAHDRVWRYADFLRPAGYTLLTCDFRSSRTIDRLPTTLGFYELQDAQAALEWLRGQPALAGRPIAVLGESLGGSVALMLAARNPDVAAVVADCPFASGRRASHPHRPRHTALRRDAERGADRYPRLASNKEERQHRDDRADGEGDERAGGRFRLRRGALPKRGHDT